MPEIRTSPATGPLHGIIAAMLTPMDGAGTRVDLVATAKLVTLLAERGVHGLFVLGTTGEGPLLSRDERKAVLEAVTATARTVPVAVHVGALTTAEACDLAQHAARSGAAAVAAIPPSYYAVTREELLAYYEAVGRAAAPLPLYLYNIPSHARNELTPDLVAELRQKIPTVAGIKDSSDDPGRVPALLRAAGPGFDVICGNDELDLAAFQAGARGIVASGAGIFPELYLDLYAAWKAGRSGEAEAAQRRINAMQQALGDGARLGWYKHVWALQGLSLGGVRPPLANPTPAEQAAIRQVLEGMGLL